MKLTFTVLFFLSFTSLISQEIQYVYYVNLENVEEDALRVQLFATGFETDMVMFRLPMYYPGTYSKINFGRFVYDLYAFDKTGNLLPVNRSEHNVWQISRAKSLFRISYRVRDTFEDTQLDEGGIIFPPTGTGIDAGKNFFINNYCFYGYFEGFKNSEVMVKYRKPPGFYASSSFEPFVRGDTLDVFSYPNYDAMHEHPVMFCLPDTTSFVVDETTFIVSVYSKTKKAGSEKISNLIQPVLNSYKTFLGGKLPTENKYWFVMYLFGEKEFLTGAGAVSHVSSSFYCLPEELKREDKEDKKKDFTEMIQSVAAHEFYHLMAGHQLYSNEYETEDAVNPVFSRHIWFYEGLTEYMSMIMRLKNGMLKLDKFAEEIEDKLNNMEEYNNKVAFTQISQGLYKDYGSEFGNAYEKGALISMCLDILILKTSDGKKNLENVIQELLKKYDKGKPFDDAGFFAELENLSSPQVGEFLRKSVDGTEPMPVTSIFESIGLDHSKTNYREIDFGDVIFGHNHATHRVVFQVINDPSKFAKNLGVKSGDEIISIDGRLSYWFNYRGQFGSPSVNLKDGDPLELIVSRKNEKGIDETWKLEAKITGSKLKYDHSVGVINQMNANQEKLRKAWMGK